MIETPERKWYVNENKPPYSYLQGRFVGIFHPNGAVIYAYVDRVDEGRMYVFPRGSKINVPMGIEIGPGFMFDPNVTEKELQERVELGERRRLKRRNRKNII